MSADRIFLAIVTIDSKPNAERIAGALLDQKLAACVNIIPGLESHYTWQGKREQSGELLLLIKTTGSKLGALEEAVLKLHPYDCPEFIAFEAAAVSEKYLSWLCEIDREV